MGYSVVINSNLARIQSLVDNLIKERVCYKSFRKTEEVYLRHPVQPEWCTDQGRRCGFSPS